jgi:formylglycine-generating enzyme required for sulfatase activity
VKIVDFGLAKLAGKTMLTKEGTTLGTVAYMSPEQSQGADVDHRTDIFSFGVLLYEMLAGRQPFEGDYEQAVIYSILNEEPEPLKSLRNDLTGELQEIVQRTLEKEPDKRHQSVDEFLHELKKLRQPEGSIPAKATDFKSFLQLFKSPRFLSVAAAIIIILGISFWVPFQRLLNRQKVAGLLPQIVELSQTGNYTQAYELALEADAHFIDDSIFQSLIPVISNNLSVISQPKGAKVFLKLFAPDDRGEFPPREFVGETPIQDLRIARGDYTISIEKDGFVPVERIASSELSRVETLTGPNPAIKIEITLRESAGDPADMVFIQGGPYRLVGAGAPTMTDVNLDDFFIDKFEVNNAQYTAFILGGGYSNRSYWKHPFIKDEQVISWEEAIQFFTDRSGLPGPRTWVNQEYPDGKDTYPVTGITWYEAAAYAEFASKNLPTIFQWEMAARAGAVTHFDGVVMPWGLVRPGQTSQYRANFNSRAPSPVDSYEFGISPYGCYNMAGNVKEWCRNEMTGGYATTGGSYEDPMYLFVQYGTFDGFFSSSATGFRCVRNLAGNTGDQGAMRINVEQRTPSYSPIDEQTFNSLLSHYKYDKKPISGEMIETIEAADWIREKIRFAGVKGDKIIAYLYLPRRVAHPLQCLVLVPGAALFLGRNLAEATEWLLTSQIKSGRAVLAVVLKGMTEREWGPGHVRPATNSVQFREEMVLHATELRMGIDYLETRDDIDMSKLAYVGKSWGAGSRVGFAAIDQRFKTVVLVGAGIDERVKPTLPEADNVNFAPYIKPPKLVVNGKYDEEHIWYSRGLPLYNLLSEPKKLVLLEGGHVPAVELRAPVINAWLDETLGPVKYQ